MPRIVPAPLGATIFIGDLGPAAPSELVAIDSLTDFRRRIEDWDAVRPMLRALEGFFLNGGRRALLLHQTASGATGAHATGELELTALDEVRDANFLVCTLFGGLEPAAHWLLANALRAYVDDRRGRDLLLLVDAPRREGGGSSASGVARAAATAFGRSHHAALFWPWVVPVGEDEGSAIPAAGHIAGTYTRTEASSGIWRPAAGPQARLLGVAALDVAVSQGDADAHGEPLNLIRHFPTTGPVVWGARSWTTDPEMRFVPVVRLLRHVELSIADGLEWTSSHENDEALWTFVTVTVEEFLLSLWRLGAFMGTRPEEAFFVRCDRTTMTQGDIDSGQLIVLVGIAPLRPAEFVTILVERILTGSTC